MTAAAAAHTFQHPIVTPAARDPWALDPDRTTRHAATSIAPPTNTKGKS